MPAERSGGIKRAAIAVALIAAGAGAGGCASKKPLGVAEVPECRSAANSVPRVDFQSKLDNLRRQADAYSDCMTGHGFELDNDRVDAELLHITQVQSSDPMRGDPWEIVATRREQLRLSASMWRPEGASKP